MSAKPAHFLPWADGKMVLALYILFSYNEHWIFFTEFYNSHQNTSILSLASKSLSKNPVGLTLLSRKVLIKSSQKKKSFRILKFKRFLSILLYVAVKRTFCTFALYLIKRFHNFRKQSLT